MTGPLGFEYAQARLQARYGQRPTASVWAQLEALKGFTAYIEAARGTVLAPWLENLSGSSDVHDVEHSVRGSLYTTIQEVAGWVPEEWMPAVTWLRWLVYLPALHHLLHGGPILPWMREGHRLRPYLQDSMEARRWSLVADGAGAFVDARDEDTPFLQAWLTEWRARWPEERVEHVQTLDRLAELIEIHARRFPDVSIDRAWRARGVLAEQLERVFRRHPLQPVAVFAYLALVALELERLRGELVRRALFA